MSSGGQSFSEQASNAADSVKQMASDASTKVQESLGISREQQGQRQGEQAREDAKGKMEEMKGQVKGFVGATDDNINQNTNTRT